MLTKIYTNIRATYEVLIKNVPSTKPISKMVWPHSPSPKLASVWPGESTLIKKIKPQLFYIKIL